MQTALDGIHREIAPALTGLTVTDQVVIDGRLVDLDGTPNKQRLGGNATVAVSLAALHASAIAMGVPLWRRIADVTGAAPRRIPLPEIQIFGGGAHASAVGSMSRTSWSWRWARTFFVKRRDDRGGLPRRRRTHVGRPRSFRAWPTKAASGPPSFQRGSADVLMRAIERAGYRPGEAIGISLDVAASEFGRDGRYELGLESREFDRRRTDRIAARWLDRYPIVSIEDPLAEDDSARHAAFTAAMGHRCRSSATICWSRVRPASRTPQQILVQRASVKPNQAGTITETKAASRWHGGMWGTIVSARSGETEERTIVHLASGWARANSRSVRSHVRNAWRNGTKPCASKRHHRPAVRRHVAVAARLGGLGTRRIAWLIRAREFYPTTPPARHWAKRLASAMAALPFSFSRTSA